MNNTVFLYKIVAYSYNDKHGMFGKTISTVMRGPSQKFDAFNYFIKGESKERIFILSVDFIDKISKLDWISVSKGKTCIFTKIKDVGPPPIFN